MNIWTLPGPARFVQRIERALRAGANVVVRFPVAAPAGFGEHVRSLLHGNVALRRLPPGTGHAAAR